jgi:hypothetical protein
LKTPIGVKQPVFAVESKIVSGNTCKFKAATIIIAVSISANITVQEFFIDYHSFS